MDTDKEFGKVKKFAVIAIVAQFAIYGAIGYGLYSLVIYAIDAFAT